MAPAHDALLKCQPPSPTLFRHSIATRVIAMLASIAILHGLKLLPPIEAQDRGDRMVLAWDNAKPALFAIDANNGRVRHVGAIRVSTLYRSRDGSRLVAFSLNAGGEPEAAIVARDSGEVVATVPIGRDCETLTSASADLVMESQDGRTLNVRCRSTLVALDVVKGTIVGRLPLEGPLRGAFPHRIDDNRVVLLPGSRPETADPRDLVVMTLGDFRVMSRVSIGSNVMLADPVVSADGQFLVVRRDSPYQNGKPSPPSEMLAVNMASAKIDRTTAVGGALRRSRISDDGRYLYLSNAGEDLPKGANPLLEIFSVEEGRVVERVPLVGRAEWATPRTRVRAHLLLNDKTLLVLQNGRVSARLIFPGQTCCYAPTVSSPDGSYLYAIVDRRLIGLRAGAEQPLDIALSKGLPWNGGSVVVSPDGARGLIRTNSSEVAVVDLATGRELSWIKTSTSGARAKLFWGDLGLTFLIGSLGGGPVDRSVPGNVAMSADSTMALVLASTGEVVMVDLRAGRLVRRLPDRAAMLFSTPGSPVTVMIAPGRVTILETTTGRELEHFEFQDAPSDQPPKIAISADASSLVVGWGSTTYVVDAQTGRLVTKTSLPASISGVSFIG